MKSKSDPDAHLLNRKPRIKDREKKIRQRGTHKESTASLINRVESGEFKNSIQCGDAIEILRKLPDACVDIVLTSPPYNFGLEYENSKDARNWEEYFETLDLIWKECIRTLRPGGRLIINVQPLFSDYIPTHHIISSRIREMGMLWKGEILWEKNNYNCKYTAWGSWKSPSMPYLKYSWEFVEIFCKETYKKKGDAADIDITGDEFKKWVYARWSIAPERKMKSYNHPAMFPEELVRRLLKLFSYRGDVVLDPFNGVGTTICTAAAMGRDWIGIDISAEYCNAAERRLSQVLEEKSVAKG